MKKSSAFTLIELLVTMFIIILLIGVMIPGLRGYSQRNDIRIEAEEIRNTIEEARSYALAPRSSRETFNLSSYRVEFFDNAGGTPDKAEVKEVYNTIPPQPSVLKTTSLVKTQFFDFTNLGIGARYIDFGIPKAEVLFPDPEVNSKACIKLRRGNNYITIRVDLITGQINISDVAEGAAPPCA